MAAMTMRERMLAVVEGRPHDRVPFVQYGGQVAANETVWELVGRENVGLLNWAWAHILETPNCQFKSEGANINGKDGVRTTLHTPEGSLYEERLYEPTFYTTSASSHYVKAPEDYRVLMAYLRDIEVQKNTVVLEDQLQELGEDGLPHTAVLRSPYQQLWIEWVGIEELVTHMAYEPALMEEVFALLEDVQRRVFQTVCEAAREVPIPYVVVPDNLTAPMIGVDYFRRHCMPAYKELAEELAETGRDIPVYVHADGYLRPLWADIGESAVRGLDSMSPPPDNDTSVADALAQWPDMRVGINFPSSVHLGTAAEVYEATRQILDEGGRSGRLQIQISENVPPEVWRTSFPEIVRAIDDFGEV